MKNFWQRFWHVYDQNKNFMWCLRIKHLKNIKNKSCDIKSTLKICKLNLTTKYKRT